MNLKDIIFEIKYRFGILTPTFLFNKLKFKEINDSGSVGERIRTVFTDDNVRIIVAKWLKDPTSVFRSTVSINKLYPRIKIEINLIRYSKSIEKGIKFNNDEKQYTKILSYKLKRFSLFNPIYELESIE